MDPIMDGNRRQAYRKAALAAFAVIAASLSLFFALYNMKLIAAAAARICSIMRPVAWGAIIAFLLLPSYKLFLDLSGKAAERFRPWRLVPAGIRDLLAVLCSLALGTAAVSAVLAVVIPQVYDSVSGLIEAVPDYADKLQEWIRIFFEDNPGIQDAALSAYSAVSEALEAWLESDIEPNLDSFQSALDWLRQTVLPNLTGVVSGVSGAVGTGILLIKDLLISVIVSAYMLGRKDRFAAQARKLAYCMLPVQAADMAIDEAKRVFRILNGFVTGKLLDSLIIGMLCLAGCAVLKMPYPVLIAVTIGVTNVIPFFGPLIGAIPCGVLIFLISPKKMLYFAAFILALQQTDGHIIGPKILGGSTGLDSFWVLFALLLFGGLFGIPGMILGVPAFAAISDIASRAITHGLKAKGLPWRTDDYIAGKPDDPDRRGGPDPGDDKHD